jgi:hypothetical protein
MARSKNTLLKGASGKISDIVTFERNGTQVIREYVIPKDRKSPAQLAQRMKCEVANKGLSPLKNFIKQGHKDNSKAYRAEISRAMKYGIVGEYPILSLDYSIIHVAEGKLQLPENVSVDFDNNNNTINLSWNINLAFRDKPGKPDDKINVIYFNEKFSKTKLLPNASKRSDGKASLKLPLNWDIDETHF